MAQERTRLRYRNIRTHIPIGSRNMTCIRPHQRRRRRRMLSAAPASASRGNNGEQWRPPGDASFARRRRRIYCPVRLVSGAYGSPGMRSKLPKAISGIALSRSHLMVVTQNQMPCASTQRLDRSQIQFPESSDGYQSVSSRSFSWKSPRAARTRSRMNAFSGRGNRS